MGVGKARVGKARVHYFTKPDEWLASSFAVDDISAEVNRIVVYGYVRRALLCVFVRMGSATNGGAKGRKGNSERWGDGEMGWYVRQSGREWWLTTEVQQHAEARQEEGKLSWADTHCFLVIETIFVITREQGARGEKGGGIFPLGMT